MPVPNTFANATATIPLSQLDANFATAITLGNTAIQLGNTVSTLNNMTLANVTVTSGNVTSINVTDVNVSNSAVISVNTSGDALRITQTGAGNAFVVEDSTNPDSTPFVIDASGNVIKGATAAITSLSGITPGSQVVGTSLSPSSFGLFNYSNSSNAGFITFAKSRNASIDGQTIVADGDNLMTLRAYGSDGTNFIQASQIRTEVDGTPGTNDMPGRLVFSTTADGGSSPTERMRIDSAGNINIATTGARITGDFSNATVANRVMFQTSTVNSSTNINAIPNGSGTASRFQAFSSSDAANFSSASLSVEGTSDVRVLSGAAGTGTYLPLTFYTGGSERMRVDTSGNVGIGTSSPTALGAGRTSVNINGSTDAILWLGSNGTYTGYVQGAAAAFNLVGDGVDLQLTATGAKIISFNANGSERARISSAGNLLVGTTSGTSHILSKNASSGYVAGVDNSASTTPFGMYVNFSAAAPNDTSRLFLSCADTSATRATIRSNGGIANFSANNVNLSDRREKANFAPAGDYLSKICAIPVQTFNYIDQNMEEDPGLTLGVVAQDVQEVAPELVMESNWGTEEEPKMRLSIYQTDLQYALMKCIQEQQQMIETLQAKVAALEGKK
jgi:hypothetical protein